MNIWFRNLPALCLTALVALDLSPCAGAASPGVETARQLNQAFAEVAASISPAVVVINVVQKPAAPTTDDEDADGNYDSLPPGFWKEFHKHFKQPFPEESRGQGSGIILKENGFLLTNGHVVEDAETIEVRLQDGRKFKATVRGIDPQSDLAVLRIEAHGLPVIRFADSSRTRVGEFAIAIGAPFSLDYSVTIGHVSAKGRSNVLQGYEAVAMDQDFIQTDALINPGNSGGPLVNIDGEVIGINTLIRGLHTGIGFAIPSNFAREVSDELIAKGKFTRAWLGISIQALRDSPEMQSVIKGVDEGVLVARILADGPAAKSDLRPTDVITAVDGAHVTTAQQLRAAVRSKQVGQPVTLDVYRAGKPIQVKVSPGEWVEPAPALAKSKPNPKSEPESVEVGIAVQPLTADLAKQFGVKATEGVLVASVEKDTPAAQMGIKPGDIITSIDQQPVNSPKQFRDALKKANLKQGILLNLVSENSARFEVLKPAP
jgi:serine protease Do